VFSCFNSPEARAAQQLVVQGVMEPQDAGFDKFYEMELLEIVA
jgi:hypothetical protein